MTCDSDTNDSGATFGWQKDNKSIDGASSNTYLLPDNKRSNSGSYQCKVKTNIVPTTQISDAKIVTFLCKLYLHATKTQVTAQFFPGTPKKSVKNADFDDVISKI